MTAKRLAMIGFDSISLSFLKKFIARGVMPHTRKLIENGAMTQTWPCFPMETGTNWACLATGASPWVNGCNMSTHLAGTPLDKWTNGFPPSINHAEQLWTAAGRAGLKSVIFDWSQSFPVDPRQEYILHVGENGRPNFSHKAVQDPCAYMTDPVKFSDDGMTWWQTVQVRQIAAAENSQGQTGFVVDIVPCFNSIWADKKVRSLYAELVRGAEGFDKLVLRGYQGEDVLCVSADNTFSEWKNFTFDIEGEQIQGAVRGKLLELSPDGKTVHFYLSQIYDQQRIATPASYSATLLERCGPYLHVPLTQQTVQSGVCDIKTYMEEMEHQAKWYNKAAEVILNREPWDLFMLKWHGTDWTNHLAMYMIDERHPMYETERAAEGWKYWDDLMQWGDDIVKTVVDAAGPDALIALVSDHGGGTQLPGIDLHHDVNGLLEQHGWLVKSAEGNYDWSRSKAYAREHYILLNVKDRDPDGIVESGAEYAALRDEIMQTLLDAKHENGRHWYQAVMTREKAGRLGVGGDRVGDIFLLKSDPDPTVEVDKEAFWKSHRREQTGTWDRPLLNTGNHLDDSYFVLAGPGVKKGYERPRPTLITSVAPTCAQAAGIPTPKDADGSVLYDFYT